MDKVVTSAACIIPEEHLWPQIQAIRSKHDKAFQRWPPHIKFVFVDQNPLFGPIDGLLYPFVPERLFSSIAVPESERALSSFRPFTIRLDTFNLFEHGKSCTVFLEPNPEAHQAIENLYSTLERAFPNCTDLRERGNGKFHGHLTVAQFSSSTLARRAIAEWKKTWQPIVFEVSALCLIARKGDTPFQVKHRTPFGFHRVTAAPTLPEVFIQRPVDAPAVAPRKLASPAVVEEVTTLVNEVASFPEISFSEEIPMLTPPMLMRQRQPSIALPDGEMGKLIVRIEKWLIARQNSALPKTKPSLKAALKPLCIIRKRPLSGTEALRHFVEEGLLLTTNGSVKYLAKSDKTCSLPSLEDSPYTWKVSDADKVLNRCRIWVLNPSNSPKTVSALEKSLDQLCEIKFVAPFDEVMALLTGLDICRIGEDRDETIIYNL